VCLLGLLPSAPFLIRCPRPTEEESEVVDSCHMDGFALLRMRVGDDSSEIQCAPSRTIWDRTVDMMLQGHRENNYDYGAWSVCAPGTPRDFVHGQPASVTWVLGAPLCAFVVDAITLLPRCCHLVG
jgi:hypothetical protein